MTLTKQAKGYSLVTCILTNFTVYLSVWEWVYLLNCVTILFIKVCKIGFLGKNWLSNESTFLWENLLREDAEY